MKPRTETHRKNLSLSKMGDKNPMKREEIRKKVSKKLKENYIEFGPKLHTPETILKMKLSATKRWEKTKRKPKFCLVISCGVPISLNSTSGLCRSCAHKKLNKERPELNAVRIKAFMDYWNTHTREGEKNPNWKEGKSFIDYPKEFTKKLKEFIRKRDDYECQGCEITEEEHLKKYKCKLHVHHIDYNKQNCADWNLISLCNKCNTKANSNRKVNKDIYSYLNKMNFLYSDYYFNERLTKQGIT